jgi:hypothetical protein
MPKKGQRVADNKREVVRRREQVTTLLVSCVPVRQIAEQLKVPLRTIERDVTEIYADLRERTKELAATARERTLRSLDLDEQVLRAKIAQVDAQGTNPATLAARSRALEVLGKLQERRLKLLGLDVTKHEVRVGPTRDAQGEVEEIPIQLYWPKGEQQGTTPEGEVKA